MRNVIVPMAVAPLAGRVVVPPPYVLNAAQLIEVAMVGLPFPPSGWKAPIPSVGVEEIGQRGAVALHRNPLGSPQFV